MKVPRRRFGRTGVDIPVLSCGGMRYQQSWDDLTPEKVDSAIQKNLEETIHTALSYGINHIETARGYGTSEMQLGWLLPRLPREELLLQTKIHPFGEDTPSLRETFEKSMKYLQVDYVDFLSIHGINLPHHIDELFRKGGAMDQVRELQREGRVRFVGYSTHGGPEIAVPAAKSGEFDYVNLHWYYVYHPIHWEMVAASAEADMGVFIISPNDKGGMLQAPSKILCDLCEPYTPMQWHDAYCLSKPEVHTLSLGAAKPTDFKEHVEAVNEQITLSEVERIEFNIKAEMEKRLGAAWLNHWHEGIPHYTKIPGEVNIEEILRLYTFEKGLDLTEWAKMRYNLLGNADHWFPGQQAQNVDKIDMNILSANRFCNDIPHILKTAHKAYVDPKKNSRLSDQ